MIHLEFLFLRKCEVGKPLDIFNATESMETDKVAARTAQPTTTIADVRQTQNREWSKPHPEPNNLADRGKSTSTWPKDNPKKEEELSRKRRGKPKSKGMIAKLPQYRKNPNPRESDS